MKQTQITFVAIALIAAAVGFGGGVKYQQMKTPATTGFQRGAGGPGPSGSPRAGGTRGGATGRPVQGEILKSDDTSVTVKMPDGSTKIVLLSDKTTITNSTTADKSALKTGTTVMIFGTDNTDGSVTAVSVQLNPLNRAFGGSPAPSAAPTASPTTKN